MKIPRSVLLWLVFKTIIESFTTVSFYMITTNFLASCSTLRMDNWTVSTHCKYFEHFFDFKVALSSMIFKGRAAVITNDTAEVDTTETSSYYELHHFLRIQHRYFITMRRIEECCMTWNYLFSYRPALKCKISNLQVRIVHQPFVASSRYYKGFMFAQTRA